MNENILKKALQMADQGKSFAAIHRETGIAYEDFYKYARDSFLSIRLPGYPKVDSFDFCLRFAISPSSKYGILVHAIINTLPNDAYTVEKNNITIHLDSTALSDYFQTITDILSVVKTWKSTSIICNGFEFDYSEYLYLLHFYEEMKNERINYLSTTTDLRIKYISKKPARKAPTAKPQSSLGDIIRLSSRNPKKALNDVINKYVELYAQNKETLFIEVPPCGRIVVIEDDSIMYFWTTQSYPLIKMQYLTHGNLAQFNYSSFIRQFNHKDVGIDIRPYITQTMYLEDSDIDRFKYIEKTFPELELKRRFEQFPVVLLLRRPLCKGAVGRILHRM